MDPTYLEQVCVEVDGRSYPLSVEYFGESKGLPAICSGTLRIERSESSDGVRIGLRLPGTLDPSERGSGDHRRLGLRIQHLRLFRQAADQRST
jgi:hypothetical protein